MLGRGDKGRNCCFGEVSSMEFCRGCTTLAGAKEGEWRVSMGGGLLVGICLVKS